MSLKDGIKEVIEKRKIPYLLHFTKLKNLESILNKGLLSKSKIDEEGMSVAINDSLRLDYRENAISTSIVFPNYKLFYGFRQIDKDKWVVLVINPQILLDNKVAFCKHNAADARISSTSIEELMTQESFEGMFEEIDEEIDEERSRRDQKLKDYDPTDSQAEILIFNEIPTKYIAGVVFDNKKNKEQLEMNYPKIKGYHHKFSKGVFATRTYYREYQ